MIYFLILILVLVLAFLLFWVVNAAMFSPNAPVVTTPKGMLPPIYEALEIRDGQTVYDLGCGDGRLLAFCAARYPNAKFIGIDSNFLVCWLARFNSRNLNNVTIIRQNFFDSDLRDGDRIYAYLFPKVMANLLSKFEKELKPNSKLVSCGFYFTHKEAESILDV